MNWGSRFLSLFLHLLSHFLRSSVIPAQAGIQATSNVGAWLNIPTACPGRFRAADRWW